ncbi:hypothetical protein ACHAWF_002121 [Thalassiosira exigua]
MCHHLTMNMNLLLLLPLIAAALPLASSFLAATPSAVAPSRQQNSFLQMAGFGTSSRTSKKKGGKKKNVAKAGSNALKPKAQWDKFKALKSSNRVAVAARVVAEGSSVDSNDWYDIGVIKSEGDEYIESAVVLQRGIIAEHARRMYPLNFLLNEMIEYAYDAAEGGGETTDANKPEWVVVTKGKEDVPPNVTKNMVGFQGHPDKSGFYTKSETMYGGGGAKSASSYDGSGTLDMSVLPRVK